LDESFDRVLKWKWENWNNATLVHPSKPNVTFQLNFFRKKRRALNATLFYYDISLERISSDDLAKYGIGIGGDGTVSDKGDFPSSYNVFGDTSTKDAFAIYNTIAQISAEFIKKQKPEGVSLSGFSDKQQAVYLRIVNRLVTKLLPDYDSLMGSGNEIWISKKNLKEEKKPKILIRLQKQLQVKGKPPGMAVGILQKQGILNKGSNSLTSHGKTRNSMNAASRAKDRESKSSGHPTSAYKYNPRTNKATLR